MNKSPKEYAKYLVASFKGYEIKTNENIACKQIALFCLKEIYKFGNSLSIREPLTYLNSVETEIKKMK